MKLQFCLLFLFPVLMKTTIFFLLKLNYLYNLMNSNSFSNCFKLVLLFENEYNFGIVRHIYTYIL